MKKIFTVGIVGAGLIGDKRAEALLRVGGCALAAVAEINDAGREAFARKYGCKGYKNWNAVVRMKEIDIVIVSVPNVFAAPIAIEALRHGKHILCEKPFGINTKESRAIIEASKRSGRTVKVGFNHRFHPAIMKAKKLFDKGVIGRLIFMRARYGHGGRKGMEKEWRFNPAISGGGELLDQGIHVIDLMRWFGGEFDSAYGVCENKVWKSKVEDNSFAILRNRDVTASFHVSVTNWGNIFSLEIFGDKGYVVVEGLGRRYGVEILKMGKRKLEFGDVDQKTFSFSEKIDMSWDREWKNFISVLRGRGVIVGSMKDGVEANRIVEAIYRSSRERKEIKII